MWCINLIKVAVVYWSWSLMNPYMGWLCLWCPRIWFPLQSPSSPDIIRFDPHPVRLFHPPSSSICVDRVLDYPHLVCLVVVVFGFLVIWSPYLSSFDDSLVAFHLHHTSIPEFSLVMTAGISMVLPCILFQLQVTVSKANGFLKRHVLCSFPITFADHLCCHWLWCFVELALHSQSPALPLAE